MPDHDTAPSAPDAVASDLDAKRTQAPGWLLHAVIVVAAVVALVARSTPHLRTLDLAARTSPLRVTSVGSALAMVVAVAAVLVWIVRFVVTVLSNRHSGGRLGRRWLVVPALTVVVAALWLSDAPLRVRWALGRDAFERELARYDPRELPSEREPVGSYEASVRRFGDGTRFYTSSSGDGGGTGFVHLPTGLNFDNTSQGFSSPNLIDLGGGWYAFESEP